MCFGSDVMCTSRTNVNWINTNNKDVNNKKIKENKSKVLHNFVDNFARCVEVSDGLGSHTRH